jgi:hypothetical protein
MPQGSNYHNVTKAYDANVMANEMPIEEQAMMGNPPQSTTPIMKNEMSLNGRDAYVS